MTATMTAYIKRILTPPNRSFFLFGPRGCGKTTWVKHEFPEAYNINLLQESLFHAYLGNASQFADELRALKSGSWVFIDEIQRLPGLLNEVHRLIEEKHLKFILSGSSARKIRRSGTNLLAGRALRRALYPFMPAELGANFKLAEVLNSGSIPLVWNAEDKKDTLQAYVDLYLKEEIKAEALVKNLPGFVRFLPISAIFHGQIINISSAARDAGISRTTLNDYFEILEDTLMAFRLPAFESKLRVREKKHPKFYWVDPGLVRALNHRFGEVTAEEAGPLFEGWIATLLRAYKDYAELYDECYYWAPAEAQKTEVDFILKRGREYLAIEVKHSRKYQPEQLKGLRAASNLPGLKKRILVYIGERRMKTEDGIDVWPLPYFLEKIESKKLWL
jgi:predicted AAA+ superfamily ATPase